MPLRLSLLITLWWSMITAAIAHHGTIIFDTENITIDVPGHGYDYYLDGTKSLTYSQIRELPDCYELKRDRKAFAPANQNIWIRIKVKYTGAEESIDMVAELADAHAEHYDIYVSRDGRIVFHREQGDSYPYKERDVDHNYFVHSFTMDKDAEYEIIYKLDSRGHEVPFPLTIQDADHYALKNVSSKLFHGLVLGLCLITSFVTLILFFIFRLRYFLIEVFVTIFSILYILAEEGYGYMYLWPESPYMNNLSRPLFVAGMLLSSLWFVAEYLDIRKKTPRLNYAIQIFFGLYMLTMLVFLPFNVLGYRNEETMGICIHIFMVMTGISAAFILFTSFYFWVRFKSRDAFIIFLVFAITVSLVGYRTLAIMGILPYDELVLHTGFIARGFHIPIIGVYLAYNAIEVIQKSRNYQIRLLKEKETANEKLVKSINDERKRISMALHDSVGSIISGLKANYESMDQHIPDISSARQYQTGLQLLSHLNEEVRNISNNLYPSTLQKLGLLVEIKRILHIVKTVYNIETHLQVLDKRGIHELDVDLQLQIYYIIRELIDNAISHSKCENLWVQLNLYEDELNLLIEDDGIGFDVEEVRKSDSSGLYNMSYRVKVLDGRLDVFSQPNEGTSVSINIPISQ